MRLPLLSFACCLLFGAGGCSSTRQIQTAPPRPAVAADTTALPAQASLSVVFETGPTPLPGAVQSLRFRVAELHLKTADGAWHPYAADVNSFEIAGDAPASKMILSRSLPPAAYDSLALTFSDVFVRYDANAGGPLTLSHGTPLKLPLTLHLATGRNAVLHLLFEPGASLTQSPDCRWFFLPFLEATIE